MAKKKVKRKKLSSSAPSNLSRRHKIKRRAKGRRRGRMLSESGWGGVFQTAASGAVGGAVSVGLDYFTPANTHPVVAGVIKTAIAAGTAKFGYKNVAAGMVGDMVGRAMRKQFNLSEGGGAKSLWGVKNPAPMPMFLQENMQPVNSAKAAMLLQQGYNSGQRKSYNTRYTPGYM